MTLTEEEECKQTYIHALAVKLYVVQNIYEYIKYRLNNVGEIFSNNELL